VHFFLANCLTYPKEYEILKSQKTEINSVVTINAFWDETPSELNILVLEDEDSEGNDCPEELAGGWVRDALPTLAKKASELNLKVWVGEEDRFLEF